MISPVLIESHFLPSLEYFVLLKQCNEVVLDRHEHFIKQTFRNRCYILGANKVLSLTVPVKKGSQKTVMEMVEIDYQHDWLRPLWRSICSAYGKSPFFEFYKDPLHDILHYRDQFLFNLNQALLSFCLDCLQIDIDVSSSKGFYTSPSDRFLDYRSQIHPKKPFSVRNLYTPYPYKQIFGSKFVPDLSIIDLLFCEGPNSGEIIKNSISREGKQTL